MFNTYQGAPLGDYFGYSVTESNIRPAACRFEASRRDGTRSIFGAVLDDLIDELREEYLCDQFNEQIEYMHEDNLAESDGDDIPCY